MQFLIDESRVFDFPKTKDKLCKVSVVSGVMLPYKAKQVCLKKYSTLPKANTLQNLEINNILDDLIARKIKVILVISDHNEMSQNKMVEYRNNFLQNLKDYAKQNPLPIDIEKQKQLNMAVHNLLWHIQKLSLQDFAKMIAICECITSCTEFFVNNANKLRAIDRREISLLIDDQPPQVRNSLMDFFYVYAWIESKQNRFKPTSESLNAINQFVIKEGNEKRLAATKIFKKTIIGNSGCLENCNLDDTYPELKIADFLLLFYKKY